ncbi:hypothetical protein BDY21DRAFT_418638 [Lineolata rhizophorae]|uniref:Uncharacterized protein n=1 Tax=Lineolata rhizophorae TaxID=578093 RepID=A0A6A6PCV8_9PEZI|nr:hypothetical protein BDY21DRAFT_418638 [Lineolata rhizophorae]
MAKGAYPKFTGFYYSAAEIFPIARGLYRDGRPDKGWSYYILPYAALRSATALVALWLQKGYLPALHSRQKSTTSMQKFCWIATRPNRGARFAGGRTKGGKITAYLSTLLAASIPLGRFQILGVDRIVAGAADGQDKAVQVACRALRRLPHWKRRVSSPQLPNGKAPGSSALVEVSRIARRTRAWPYYGADSRARQAVPIGLLKRRRGQENNPYQAQGAPESAATARKRADDGPPASVRPSSALAGRAARKNGRSDRVCHRNAADWLGGQTIITTTSLFFHGPAGERMKIFG